MAAKAAVHKPSDLLSAVRPYAGKQEHEEGYDMTDNTPNDVSRRHMLTRIGTLAAVAYTVPAFTTLSMAHASSGASSAASARSAPSDRSKASDPSEASLASRPSRASDPSPASRSSGASDTAECEAAGGIWNGTNCDDPA